MFSDLLHLVGMFFSVEMPSLFAPRHWGQFSARTFVVKSIHTERREKNNRMGGKSLVLGVVMENPTCLIVTNCWLLVVTIDLEVQEPPSQISNSSPILQSSNPPALQHSSTPALQLSSSPALQSLGLTWPWTATLWELFDTDVSELNQ